MTRRFMLTALAGLVAGVVATGSLGFAQPTQSGIKNRAKESAQHAQDKWQSLTPEQQQQAIERGKEGAQKAEDKWQSMSPEQQDQAKQRAKAGAQKARTKWQQLPQ